MTKVLIYGSKLSNNFGGPSIFLGTSKLFDRDRYQLFFTPQSKEDEPAIFKRYLEDTGIEFQNLPRIRVIYRGGMALILSSLLPGRLKTLCIRTLKKKNEFCKVLSRYDLVCDIRGISQTDFFGYGLRTYLGENMILLSAKILGKKAMKLTQDMGPFNKLANRIIVKSVFPKYDLIIARGIVTKELLNEIGISKNVVVKPDTAFLLDTAGAIITGKLLENYGLIEKEYIVIVASRQVDRRSNHFKDSKVSQYVYNLVGLIDKIQEENKFHLVLLPNERTSKEGVSDDLTVAHKIKRLIKKQEGCIIIEEKLNAKELKSVIANAHIAITSRYHSVVAALSSYVPVFVVGWGYKYDQILAITGMSGFISDHKNFDAEKAYPEVKRLIINRNHYSEILRSNVPEIMRDVQETGQLF